MPMLLSTHISKKDEHGGKVEERYAVLLGKLRKYCHKFSGLDEVVHICFTNRSLTAYKKISHCKQDVPVNERSCLEFLVSFAEQKISIVCLPGYAQQDRVYPVFVVFFQKDQAVSEIGEFSCQQYEAVR